MSQSLPNPEGQESEDVEMGLTLLRLGLWTEEIKLKMRLMVLVVDEAKGASSYSLVG